MAYWLLFLKPLVVMAAKAMFSIPPLPRWVSAEAWKLLWWDGVFRGFTLASIFWIALIVFALIVATAFRKYQ